MNITVNTAGLAVLSALVLAILGIEPAIFVAAVLPLVIIVLVTKRGGSTGDTR